MSVGRPFCVLPILEAQFLQLTGKKPQEMEIFFGACSFPLSRDSLSEEHVQTLRFHSKPEGLCVFCF